MSNCVAEVAAGFVSVGGIQNPVIQPSGRFKNVAREIMIRGVGRFRSLPSSAMSFRSEAL